MVSRTGVMGKLGNPKIQAKWCTCPPMCYVLLALSLWNIRHKCRYCCQTEICSFLIDLRAHTNRNLYKVTGSGTTSIVVTCMKKEDMTNPIATPQREKKEKCTPQTLLRTAKSYKRQRKYHNSIYMLWELMELEHSAHSSMERFMQLGCISLVATHVRKIQYGGKNYIHL